MEDSGASFERRADETTRGKHQLRMLRWTKSETGKSAAEITNLIIRWNHDGINRQLYQQKLL